MRMQTKVFLASALYLGGGLVVMILSDTPDGGFHVLPILLWCAAFMVGQFFLFKCPHCGSFALYRGGWATPFVGGQCEKCGKDY